MGAAFRLAVVWGVGRRSGLSGREGCGRLLFGEVLVGDAGGGCGAHRGEFANADPASECQADRVRRNHDHTGQALSNFGVGVPGPPGRAGGELDGAV